MFSFSQLHGSEKEIEHRKDVLNSMVVISTAAIRFTAGVCMHLQLIPLNSPSLVKTRIQNAIVVYCFLNSDISLKIRCRNDGEEDSAASRQRRGDV